MEAGDGVVCDNVGCFMNLTSALAAAGIELIGDNAFSLTGGRGGRMTP
jgi:hypothetical protein